MLPWPTGTSMYDIYSPNTRRGQYVGLKQIRGFSVCVVKLVVSLCSNALLGKTPHVQLKVKDDVIEKPVIHIVSMK